MYVRVAILSAILVAGAVAGAEAGYVVKLDNGKQLTADGYWEENGQIHLQNGGVALAVPRERVISVRKTAEGRRPIDTRKLAPARAVAGSVDEPLSREEFQRREEKVSWRLLRRQRERFEARVRGASEAELKRIEERFRKAQSKYGAVQRELGNLP